MTHPHEHEHAPQGGRALVITLIITLVFMVTELVGGLLSGSLALVGDAGHMLVDVLALGLSLFAAYLARRPSTLSRTFGYHRVEIMAALANGSVLVLVSAFIFFEAADRFRSPPEVKTPLMITIAVIGLLANIAGILVLRRTSETSLNLRGAFFHVLGDAMSSVGVIVAGVIIAITGWNPADPVVAVIIGIIILWGSIRLVRDSVDILMEAVPKNINAEAVVGILKKIPGVEEIHDIHIWTITSGIVALSAHLMIADQMVSVSTDVRDSVNRELKEQFGITHTTLQLESSRCENCPVGVVCQLARPEED